MAQLGQGQGYVGILDLADLAGFGDSYVVEGDQVYVVEAEAPFVYRLTFATPNGTNIIKAVNLPGAWINEAILAAAEFTARGIATVNVASLAAFTVAGNDGITYVAGDIVFLAAQTAPAQNGPYVVGTVAVGVAPLTRPSWWATGAVLPSGISVAIGGEGTVYKNTVWQAMLAAKAFTVGTTDPVLYPRALSGTTALVLGTFTISAPILSAKTAIYLSRSVGNTPAASAGGYHPTTGNADGITPGPIGTGQAVIEATIAAGTLNNADISTLHWTVINQAA